MLIGTGIIGVPKQQKTCALRLPLNMTIFHTNYKLYKELSSPSLIVNKWKYKKNENKAECY
jgi:hypothetical protein